MHDSSRLKRPMTGFAGIGPVNVDFGVNVDQFHISFFFSLLDLCSGLVWVPLARACSV